MEINVPQELQAFLQKNDEMFISTRARSVESLASVLAEKMGVPVESNLIELLPRLFDSLDFLPIYRTQSRTLAGLMLRPKLLDNAVNRVKADEVDAAFQVLKREHGKRLSISEVFPPESARTGPRDPACRGCLRNGALRLPEVDLFHR